MKTKLLMLPCLTASLLALAIPVRAVDLLQRYPTQLVAGDTDPDHARPWKFAQEDIFQVSQFSLKVGDQFSVETGAADLGIGHCSDGAVWAVLMPRDQGTLTSPVTDKGAPIAHVWLRFHPAQISRLFPPASVSTDGNTALVPQIRAIANRKLTSSWHAGGNALIPGPKELTVYVDTKDGSHRFFMVDTGAKTAEYVDAFNGHSSSAMPEITPGSLPPVVTKTVPESGSMDVPPGEFEVKVTFSKEMMDGSWSWCTVWDDSTPAGIDSPKYDAARRTCTMKVKLEAGKTYGYWLNTERFRGFQDKDSRMAVPYLLVFSTAGQGGQTAEAGAASDATGYIQQKLKLAEAGNYWAKFNLWEAYAQGTHDVVTNAAEANKWLAQLTKGVYLAKFEPINGFNPSTPSAMLDAFSEQCRLFSGKQSLGGASFFRTTRQDGKLIGSFLTGTPDDFKGAVERSTNFKLISIEPVTPETFLAHEASQQQSL